MKYILIISLFFISCKTKKYHKLTNNDLDLTKDLKQQKPYKISDYQNNKDYFIRDIDINKDGILDKVVCSEKYIGNELLFFQKNKEKYEFVVKTINFSEDGGQIIDDVTYYIEFKNGEWKLKKTIYKTRYWQKNATKIYICEVKQDLLMNELINEERAKKINRIPEEGDRQKKCKSFIENK